MENNANQQRFIILCAQKQITVPAEVEALKLDIIKAMPEAVRQSYEQDGMDEYQMAAQYFNTYWEAKSGNVSGGVDPTQTRETAPTDVTYTAEEMNAIQQYMDMNAQQTSERAAKTRVLKILYDKPVLADIITPGAKLIPAITEKTWQNFDKWESKLLQNDEENKRKFNEIKNAVSQKQEMPVYINPNQKPKIIGYQLATTDANGQAINKNLTKESALDFLLMDVQGYVQARGEDSVGIRLSWVTRRSGRANNNEAGAVANGAPVVRILNRKALSEHPELTEITCVISEINGNRTVNDSFNARSDAFFVITDGKKNAKGDLITTKKRIAGKTSVYRVERKPEFVTDFGPAERQKGVGMSNKERKSINDAMNSAIGAALHSTANLSPAMKTMAAQIRQNMAASKGFR